MAVKTPYLGGLFDHLLILLHFVQMSSGSAVASSQHSTTEEIAHSPELSGTNQLPLTIPAPKINPSSSISARTRSKIKLVDPVQTHPLKINLFAHKTRDTRPAILVTSSSEQTDQGSKTTLDLPHQPTADEASSIRASPSHTISSASLEIDPLEGEALDNTPASLSCENMSTSITTS